MVPLFSCMQRRYFSLTRFPPCVQQLCFVNSERGGLLAPTFFISIYFWWFCFPTRSSAIGTFESWALREHWAAWYSLAFCNLLSNSNSNHLINTKGATVVDAVVHVDKQFLLVLETNMFWQVRWFNAQKSSLSENEPTRVMHHSCVALQTPNEGPSHRTFSQDWLDSSTEYVARSKNIHCNPLNLQPTSQKNTFNNLKGSALCLLVNFLWLTAFAIDGRSCLRMREGSDYFKLMWRPRRES